MAPGRRGLQASRRRGLAAVEEEDPEATRPLPLDPGSADAEHAGPLAEELPSADSQAPWRSKLAAWDGITVEQIAAGVPTRRHVPKQLRSTWRSAVISCLTGVSQAVAEGRPEDADRLGKVLLALPRLLLPAAPEEEGPAVEAAPEHPAAAAARRGARLRRRCLAFIQGDWDALLPEVLGTPSACPRGPRRSAAAGGPTAAARATLALQAICNDSVGKAAALLGSRGLAPATPATVEKACKLLRPSGALRQLPAA